MYPPCHPHPTPPKLTPSPVSVTPCLVVFLLSVDHDTSWQGYKEPPQDWIWKWECSTLVGGVVLCEKTPYMGIPGWLSDSPKSLWLGVEFRVWARKSDLSVALVLQAGQASLSLLEPPLVKQDR